ncbi:hypothetical protein C3743_26800 [Burkholderia contaminans]|uniref:Uncharacterized protein n=1 Tax=Burkholderia contaminans TaxID=488447 RepID=A0A2S5DX55_9BURK|nr:hypothetical protein C3743_26800 [Burkholderia contaminans]
MAPAAGRPFDSAFIGLSPQRRHACRPARLRIDARETLINGPTSEVAGEMASNFLDDEANRRSIQ